MNFVGYIVDFLMICILHPHEKLSNLKEKFDRFFMKVTTILWNCDKVNQILTITQEHLGPAQGCRILIYFGLFKLR